MDTQTRLEKKQIAELKTRLFEAEETLRAIQQGEVDALVVSGTEGDRVFTLQGAEKPYRILMEAMNEGALMISPDGAILYANQRFADLTKTPLEQVIGSFWQNFFQANDQAHLKAFLSEARFGGREEFALQTSDGSLAPVQVSLRSMETDGVKAFAAIVTDLQERKATEAALEFANEQLELRVRERTLELTRANERLMELHSLAERRAAELDAVFESMPDAVYIGDQNGISKCNAHARQMLGVTSLDQLRRPPEELGKKIAVRWPVDGRHLAPGELQFLRALKGEVTIEEVVANRLDNQEEVHIRAASAPIVQDEEIIGAVSIISDITRRKLMEDNLRKSEELHRTFFELASVGLAYASPNGRLLRVNEKYCEITGYSAEELLQMTMVDLTHPEDREADKARFDAYVRGDLPEIWTEKRYLRKGGAISWVMKNARMIRDNSGKPLRSLVAVYEISDRKQAEQSLRQAQAALQLHAENLEGLVAERTAKLRETISELEAFSYSLSHDMRAPLRSIQSYSEIALEEIGDKVGPPTTEYLQRVIRSARRLDSLIQDVLNLARFSRQEMSLQTVDLEKLLLELIAERSEFQAPCARLEISYPLETVLGHEASLTQCLTNLLSNAVKFVKPGCIPHVRIWTELREQQVRVWIQDNGIGVSEQSRERIFEMFHCVDPGAYDGTGIGLAIVSRAMERMGGQVGVESQPGQGSRFWFQLNRG